MDKNMLDLLYRSYDETLSLEKQRELERALKESPELRKEKEQIGALRGALTNTRAESFSPFFAERVTNRLINMANPQKVQQEFFESLNFIFKRVIIAGSIATLILFSVNILYNDTNSYKQEMTSTSEVTLEEDAFAAYLTSLEDVL